MMLSRDKERFYGDFLDRQAGRDPADRHRAGHRIRQIGREIRVEPDAGRHHVWRKLPVSKMKKRGKRTGMFVLLCIAAFIVSALGSAIFKMTYTPKELRKYSVDWNESVGTAYTDIAYGDAESNKFDLYVPADNTKDSYGLIVYLHAGGFTTGDKADDAATLEYYCSLGYVTAGINYTLRDDVHPDASVYTQSMEIKAAVPYVVEKAKELGYHIDGIAMSGGSAGGCLALIYAYRDAEEAPVPVKLVFEGVGPSSFYPEDWTNYGFDKDKDAAAGIFSVMRGETITADMFGTKEYDELMKQISALLNIDENTVPTVMAYGMHDTFQPYLGSVRLDEALTKVGVDHTYIVFEHSGHGLQNDNKQSVEYAEAVLEYLAKYMPVE